MCEGEEIEKPKAEVVKLRRTAKRNRFEQYDDIQNLRNDLLALANRIEAVKDKTQWPNWSQCQADSMREYAQQLNPDNQPK